MAEINFKKGNQVSYNSLVSKDVDSIYIMSDSNRGYLNNKRLWATTNEVPIIYYSDTVEGLYGSPKIGDYGYITSNGASTGELLYVYKWNAFIWELYSTNPNL